MEERFAEWLGENLNISESSIGKYKRAIRAVTKDMEEEGVIEKDLYLVTSPTDFYRIKEKIFENKFFYDKDTRGNRMYSVAMNHYYEFLVSINSDAE